MGTDFSFDPKLGRNSKAVEMTGPLRKVNPTAGRGLGLWLIFRVVLCLPMNASSFLQRKEQTSERGDVCSMGESIPSATRLVGGEEKLSGS